MGREYQTDHRHCSCRQREQWGTPIDTAVSGDTTVDEKEQQKVDKYQDLAREIKRLWKVAVKSDTHRHWHFGNNTRRSGGQPENIENNNTS